VKWGSLECSLRGAEVCGEGMVECPLSPCKGATWSDLFSSKSDMGRMIDQGMKFILLHVIMSCLTENYYGSIGKSDVE
jgi:hypothetical protein